jgi:hypothetical protein
MNKLIIVLAALASITCTAFGASAKVRRIELKTIEIKLLTGQTAPLNYAQLIREVLIAPAPQGSSAAELSEGVYLWRQIAKDIPSGTVTISEEDYQLLSRRLAQFKFAPPPEAVEAIVDFRDYIAGIKPEDVALK